MGQKQKTERKEKEKERKWVQAREKVEVAFVVKKVVVANVGQTLYLNFSMLLCLTFP